MEQWRMRRVVMATAVLATLAVGSMPHAQAASHREAALLGQDPGADQTDTYAFRSNEGGVPMLTVIANYIPAEEPGAGPNYYRFNSDILYSINIEKSGPGGHLTGNPTFSYQFRFTTRYLQPATILTYGRGPNNPGLSVGPIASDTDFAHMNEVNTYTVNLINNLTHGSTLVSSGQTLYVPPDNIGVTTPLYSVDGTGKTPPVQGATTNAQLDPYTKNAIYTLNNGAKVFAGQRSDTFAFDIAGTFDLLNLRNPGPGVGTLHGYNTHTMAIEIPVSTLVSPTDPQIVGVWSTSSRQSLTIRNGNGVTGTGSFVQEGRLGNPGVNEVLIPASVRDYWDAQPPSADAQFDTYLANPELALLLNAVFQVPVVPFPRNDLVSLFDPDELKVDLSTGPVRLDTSPGFSRLSFLGPDLIFSPYQGTNIPSGFPNGRRLGDDVIDLALTVIGGTLLGDGVDTSGLANNVVFPFMPTPQNGRNHNHDPNNTGANFQGNPAGL